MKRACITKIKPEVKDGMTFEEFSSLITEEGTKDERQSLWLWTVMRRTCTSSCVAVHESVKRTLSKPEPEASPRGSPRASPRSPKRGNTSPRSPRSPQKTKSQK
eukprot:gnl/TRDRNA2_/TRDRNA2_86518_c0_seq1.p2 gnl/TRDRNA2_/TRDRNA2_86518_c0~~gnl/TRDRNA2_/TRDRNA2_86518_c0_seq1.p2  ORF type:complete len:104 (+),score=2.24 gnl/TRDRNA2_/TRDRNA2_86518_c0_seq1:105-416(+)